jgi:hypothetical protein
MKKEYDFSRGRRGAVIRPKGKTRITIYLDDDVLERFRKRADAAGLGYQTLINQTLRDHLGEVEPPVNEETLRRVLRDELQSSGRPRNSDVTTRPLSRVLDRDRANASVADLVALASPLLQEVVNHATHAFIRCQPNATGEMGVDLPVLILYRHIIELTDAIEVLLANSCVPPAIPLLRSSLESSLGLQFILSGSPDEFRRRARSWLCVYTHKRMQLYDLVEPDRVVPRKKRKGEVLVEPVTAREAKENLAKSLDDPDLAPIEQEYERVSQRRKDPAWYSLFDGPSTLRDLAKQLGREDHYTHLYKHWSTYSHGGDASAGFTASSSGGVAFNPLRSPENLISLADLAVHLQLDATNLLIQKYRPGENLRTWYLEEVQPKQETLRSFRVEIETEEW